jgi:hypothetical protein
VPRERAFGSNSKLADRGREVKSSFHCVSHETAIPWVNVMDVSHFFVYCGHICSPVPVIQTPDDK